ncbi:hypothetical protein MLD52_01185 [Puniceicoccaceae bacterium K14]|nr:hypothetical protein [Puniceicoccaceae bacterium K14]
MNKKSAIFLGFSLVTSLLVGGCYSNNYSSNYPRSSVGTVQSVSKGTVLDVRHVNIEGRASLVGYNSGTILGAAVGQSAGSGTGRVIAAAGGAVVGGLVGLQVEKAVTGDIGQEMTIELEDGTIMVVVHKGKYPEFIEGDQVEVLETPRGQAQVRHDMYES